jgi:outer membrane protein assembly factor BamB
MIGLSSIATLALIIALIVASAGAFFVMRGGETPGSDSRRYAAMGGTPEATAGQDISATFAQEPMANWSIPFPAGTVEATTGKAVVRNGFVYRQLRHESNSEDGYFNGVQAIDAVSGEIAWTNNNTWVRTFFTADESHVYSTQVANMIVAHDALTGEEVWSTDFTGSIVSAALYDEVIYVWSTTHEMVALEAATGETIWTSGVESAGIFEILPEGNPLVMFDVVADEDVVAAVTADDKIVAFDRKSGEILWQAEGYNPVRTQLATTNGVLLSIQIEDTGQTVVDSPTRHAVGFDLASGEVLYGLTIDGPFSTIVTPGGTEMFHLIANEVQTGDSPDATGRLVVDFEYNGSNGLWTAPEGPGPYGDNPPSGADFVFGIDAATGQVNWKRSAIGEGFAGLFSSYASSERLWALTYDNQIVLLNGEQGMILDPPVTLENAVKNLVPGTVEEGIAVELLGGTLIGYGAVSRDQQG